MRYAEGHKKDTHRHIVRVASQQFRAHGIEKTSVAVLMERAGLTVGGFYGHFKSKDELIQEVIVSAANDTLCRIFDAEEGGSRRSLKTILESYLSVDHRDNPQSGCVIAALASELKSSPRKTRAVAGKMTQEVIRRIMDRLSSKADVELRLRIASSIWAMMVGTLQLSRIVSDPALSVQLLTDGVANALKLAAAAEMRDVE